MDDLNVVGVSAHFHDAACCVIRDGALVAAAQEERFSRIKHDPATPIHAFRYCLREAGLDITRIDCLAYYEDPALKADRQAAGGARPGAPARRDPVLVLRRLLGYEGDVRCFRHHRSHAASAFCFSGYEDAAVLTVDGVGEWTTTAYWRAGPGGLDLVEEVAYPHSLGLLYSAFTAYLGFSVNDSEYKVMGLAPYGRPTLLDRLRAVVEVGPLGQFRLDMRYFDYLRGERMHSDALAALLGRPPRGRQEPLDAFHADLACSVQALLEEILLQKVRYLHERVPSGRLCLAGGVALNCVANGRICREGPFDEVFIQPAAGDAGGALGAAALAYAELRPGAPLRPLRDVFLGPSSTRDDVRALLASTPIAHRELARGSSDLHDQVATYLAEGRVVGWFQGRMEFGPRALGGRSILADPRSPTVKDRINAAVKNREAFRPFAPAVLAHRAAEHFDLAGESPFMLLTAAVRSPLSLPAITHVDGSARVQTVDPGAGHPLARLLEAFERRTGCPVLLNTSFNIKDEPIVCTPEEAIVCFARSEMDVLVLEDFVIERSGVPAALIAAARRAYVPRPLGVSERLYTLV